MPAPLLCPRRCLPAGLMMLTMVCLASCGPTGPKTYPVQGKVTFKGKAGSEHRLEGGKVLFQSTSDPDLTAIGVIDADGSFSMDMLLHGKGFHGVPAGEYRARLEPPLDDDRKPARGLFHPKYQDFGRSGLTYTVPLPNDILIELDPTGR